MRKIDLTGQRFGHLIVTREAPHKIEKNGRKRVRWYCNCDCGTKDVIADSNGLRMGNIISCGGKCKLRIKPNNYAAKNTVYLYYKNNAKKTIKVEKTEIIEYTLLKNLIIHICILLYGLRPFFMV